MGVREVALVADDAAERVEDRGAGGDVAARGEPQARARGEPARGERLEGGGQHAARRSAVGKPPVSPAQQPCRVQRSGKPAASSASATWIVGNSSTPLPRSASPSG